MSQVLIKSMFELIALSIFINLFFFKYFDKISNLFNLYDFPNEKRKIHGIKISNVAGFVFAINTLLIYFYYIFNNNIFFNIYIFSLIFFFIGFLDDKNFFSPISKLLISIIIIYVSIIFNDDFQIRNLKIDSINIDLNLGKYSIFFTILCVLLLVNALNMFDGINLQSGLYILTVFIIFVFLSIYVKFSLVTLVSLLIFLYFNFKNKIFLGNSGIWLFSYFISHALISSFNKKLIDTEFILMILIFPGLDMFRVFLQRVFSKKNPFNADKIHIHHILLNFFNEIKVVIIVFLGYFIPIIFYKITNAFIPSFTIVVLIYLIIFIYFGILKKNC